MSTLLLAAAFFALATVADCVTTARALGRGFVEGNPIARWLYGKHVVLGAAIVNGVGLGLALWGGQYAPVPASVVLGLLGVGHVVAAYFNEQKVRRSK